jgi:hypothetical protein
VGCGVVRQVAQKAYGDATGKVTSSTKAKQDALNFWNEVKDACVAAPPSLFVPASVASKSSKHMRMLGETAERRRRNRRKLAGRVE